MKFEPNQRVKVKYACEVIGKHLRRGQKGIVYAVSNSLGEPIYRVKFDNDISLPMRGEELMLEEE